MKLGRRLDATNAWDRMKVAKLKGAKALRKLVVVSRNQVRRIDEVLNGWDRGPTKRGLTLLLKQFMKDLDLLVRKMRTRFE